MNDNIIEQQQDVLDKDAQRLAFEHSLRHHGIAAYTLLERAAEELSMPNARWEIRYSTSDGGSWRITTWSFGSDAIAVNAAELFRAVDNMIIAMRNTQSSKILRTALAHQENI